jgi:hypothetical protein
LKKPIEQKPVCFTSYYSFECNTFLLDHVSLTTWAVIMSDVLQVDLPWLILRGKLVQEDEMGVLYKTMFDDYILDNSKFQMVFI